MSLNHSLGSRATLCVRAMALVAFGLLIAIAPASALNQFDLSCAVETHNTMRNFSQTFTVHLSVDLDAKEWCDWLLGCDQVEPLEIRDDAIRIKYIGEDTLLRNPNGIVKPDPQKPWDWISRHEEFRVLDFTSFVITSGECKQSRFTPFPAFTEFLSTRALPAGRISINVRRRVSFGGDETLQLPCKYKPRSDLYC